MNNVQQMATIFGKVAIEKRWKAEKERVPTGNIAWASPDAQANSIRTRYYVF
ncbi:MAG TPA: hypothetical protein VEH06_12945 [Candidatus Bathyarchaeia archaeon]|nr:hypothetical protein [Candidatus Bathyarchaeia archaeon]